MRKLLAAIFGSSKNTETIVDGAVAGLDKIVFTQEERSDANLKMSEWYLRYLQATEPQNLARRLIAILIVCLWGLLVLIGAAARGVEVAFNIAGEDSFSLFVFQILADIVNAPFLMVMGFYFAAHLARAWQGEAQK